MEHSSVSLLLVYIAVVVTVVALSVRHAVHRLTAITKPRMAISNVTLEALDGIVCDPKDWGVQACCVTLTSPLPLQLGEVSYTVQVGEHDPLSGSLTRVQAVALLRYRGFDERTFAIPHLEGGAYLHAGQDLLIAALTMPVARQVHRLEVVLALTDAGGRTVRMTVDALTKRRLPEPIDATERRSVG